MTPEYVRAQVRYAHSKQISCGMLVHRLRSNDPAPEEDEKDYRRYINGPLGHLIEH